MAYITPVQRLKLRVLERGISVDAAALGALTDGGAHRLVEHDYVTTGGLTLVLPGDIYVNAPVDYAFCGEPAARLEIQGTEFVLSSEDVSVPVRALPLPSYLFSDSPPRGIMTHADRVRISPIDGCACTCRFCDWPLIPYATLDRDDLLSGLSRAVSDQVLHARHVLVSGGTPRPGDRDFMDDVYLSAIAVSPLPVDVMLMPREDQTLVDRLVEHGVAGFSINIEVFDRDAASNLCPNKEHLGLDAYARFLRHAVERTGGAGSGRVRSLLLVGLEDAESTLEGVRFLAELGVDPVLSPFRPAEGTELASTPPPSAEFMEDVYVRACEIASDNGVKLGPRCIPCQHNTITFPDGSSAYYFS